MAQQRHTSTVKHTQIQETDAAKSKRSKWAVVAQDTLPHFMKDNEYLLHGHRPELNSIWECCKSIFMIHTETCNIWTHFLGAVGTVLLAIYYLVTYATDWQHGIVFSVFFFGAVFCMGASTVYHILGCHSEDMAKLWAKMDYCGIIVLIVTSFAPWVYFGFYCHGQAIKAVYMGGVSTLGAFCIYFVTHDKFKQPRFRPIRAGLFIALGLTGIFPGVHYILTDGQTVGYYGWLLFMAFLYIAGGVIYAARIPERLWPGKFDIWCQSHQILHLCVIGGVLACYHGSSKLAHHRIVFGNCDNSINSTMTSQWQQHNDGMSVNF